MEKYCFDLDEELIKDLSEEFNPLNFVKVLALPNPEDFEAMSIAFKSNMGANSTDRTTSTFRGTGTLSLYSLVFILTKTSLLPRIRGCITPRGFRPLSNLRHNT